MNPLILHLKWKYYWMIAEGNKEYEYREYKPYWISRIKEQKEIIFVPGYDNCNSYDLKADIKFIRIIGKRRLPDYVKEEFKKSKCDRFYQIYFKLRKCNEK